MNPHRPIPNHPGPSHDEEQLIAFHLGEPCDECSIRARLERDTAFADLSDEIAHTLRVFSAEPAPAANTEAAWQHLRPTLPLFNAPRRRLRWPLFIPVAGLAMLLLAVGLIVRHRHIAPTVDSAGAIYRYPPLQSTSRTAEADHLDRAERWLTAVNHTTEPLAPATRAESEHLRTENALYLQSARAHGDLPDAAVLDRLDRVLTTASHPAEGGLQLRVQMNTDGLLFELRILRQNQTAPDGDPR